MKTISEPLKKFILIGLSIFIYKIVFIAYAYTFNQTQYNLFNQSYYTASILILFGALGFNIAQTRIPIKPLAIFFLAAVNLVMTYSILHLISNPFSEITEIIPVIIYSIFSAVGGVLTFKLLFDGKYQIYFWVMLIFAAAHFMIIPAVVFLNVSIFPALSLLIIIWFFAVYGFFDKEVSDSKNYTEYFKVGFSAFVINSAVSLGLAGDKFIVNHFFTVDIANTYTFAWGLTAPIFYIGNLIEKYLYAEPKPDKSRILKKGFIFSLLLISAYTLGIVTVVKFFPSLLPATISKELFGSIFIFMITGYSLYVILHFPINTYLFKVTGTKKQKIISVYFTFIILFFVFVFYYIVNNPFEITYQMLLAAVWFYIFLLLVVKSFIIFKGKESDSDKKDEIISSEIQGIP
ncbi:MAG: hypothetical protein MUF28_02235 [Ignavibacterium sp.]|nr:hypothetical protein [Ignavibacterium sp.]